MESELDALQANLAATKKYRFVYAPLLRRIGAWALEREPNLAAATKRAKRKLHQIYGAYQTPAIRRVAKLFDSVDFEDEAGVESFCRQVLAAHVSTAERSGHMKELYCRIFEGMPEYGRVVDLGGGWQPFALPWMQLPRSIEYFHIDIDTQLADFINRFFAKMEQTGGAICRDLITEPYTDPSHLTLAFKLVSNLDQQDSASLQRLLLGLSTKRLVVSFPNGSIGGKQKGMRANYETIATEMFAKLELEVEAWRFPTETYYVADCDS